MAEVAERVAAATPMPRVWGAISHHRRIGGVWALTYPGTMKRLGLQRIGIALGSLALAGLAGCGGAATIAPPVVPATDVRDAAPAAEARPARKISPRIAEAAFHRGLLWLRDVRGTLAAVEPGRGVASAHLAAEHVVDIHRTLDDRLWVLSTTEHDVHLWERVDGGFRPVLEMAAPSSPLLAVADDRGRPAILARRAVFFVDEGGTLRGTSLDDEVKPGLVRQVSFAVSAAGSAYAGTSSGEWGGALYRIRLSSGEVQRVERVDRPGLCSGPLNPKCDPVTSIIPDPDAPKCVLVGIGLRHFMEHGRLLRACDRGVRVVWSQERKTEPARLEGRRRIRSAPFLGQAERTDDIELEGELEPMGEEPVPESEELVPLCAIDPSACPAAVEPEPEPSTAVFGLSRTLRGFWMVVGSSLYYAQGGRFRPIDLPRLEKRAGVALGWLPGAVVVATDVNWAASVSGYTPLVAATSLQGPE